MKKIFSYLLLLTTIIIYGQETLTSKVDLSKFCPYKESQYKATCYSYAVVYTCLSAEYNILNNITDCTEINKKYFSSGYIASLYNSSLPLFKRSPHCGRNGCANGSLKMLKKEGTVFTSDYDCNCNSVSKINSELPKDIKKYKIKDFASKIMNNQYSMENLYWIKNWLSNKHPIIIGFYQNTKIYTNKNKGIDDIILDEATMSKIKNSKNSVLSNHVICIVGYDDNYKNGKGYFLVKNNYNTWGDGNGFAWIPYTYLLPLIQEAYYIDGIQ